MHCISSGTTSSFGDPGVGMYRVHRLDKVSAWFLYGGGSSTLEIQPGGYRCTDTLTPYIFDGSNCIRIFSVHSRRALK